VNVPDADRLEYNPASCDNNATLGLIERDYLDPVLQNYITTTLGPKAATTFPFFLTHNVVTYHINLAPGNCCTLGYHNAMVNAGKFQTYGIGDYDDTGVWAAPTHDVSILSHEVGEWLDDPTIVNGTDPWGHIGQVSSCQTNYEVGDPLTGTNFTDNLNGFNYSLQQLAFFSWYYHEVPSRGVNGWYSDQGTFTTPAAPCP
jgi:hypothetical protein